MYGVQYDRFQKPEVEVVNISHKKIIEENRQIPVNQSQQINSSTTTSTSTSHHGVQTEDPRKHHQEETHTFSKDMLDQLPNDCKKYVDDFMKNKGMNQKNIEHVTIHTTRENMSSSSSNTMPNDIPHLQVKNCLQSDDKILVEIDASGFRAEDLTLKTNGRNLTLLGRSEGPDPLDPYTTLKRELKRDIIMPPGVDALHISCTLQRSTGRFTITIPFPQPTGVEMNIPIRAI